MSRRDEAVEAGARAILHGATIDSFYAQGDWEAAGYDVQQSVLKASSDALEAALAVLQPTVPNEVETLDALPVGTVIRIDTHAYVHSAAWEWVETITGTAYTADELDAKATIIHQPEETK